MSYVSPYGKPEGLADRLDAHADQLAKDKVMPWLGMGLHADLVAAAAALRTAGNPKPMEYDL